MAATDSPHRAPIDRRRFLATSAACGLGALSGCLRRFRATVGRDNPNRLSLTVTTVPADEDRAAVQIARRLTENLEAVGIATTLSTVDLDEYRRTVLINNDFDICVGRHPGGPDPDFLYETFHSRFIDEPGWQNPYGFASMAFDHRLENQRIGGDERDRAVASVLRGLADEQPVVSVCAPDAYRLVRTDRFDGWGEYPPTSRLAYVTLEPRGDEETVTIATRDPRVTKNLNPLSAEYRDDGLFVDLIYDSLATWDDDSLRAWLASSIERNGSTATVTLREDVHWHDGEAFTARDVAFTYYFLEDTTLGAGEIPSPAPRYRGEVSLVERVDVLDDSTCEIELVTGSGVGERALTVPILPEHVWSERTDVADFPGISVAGDTTEAVVSDNVPAIGSGPFAFVERSERERLVLERFEEHFSTGDPDLPQPGVDGLVVRVVPRDSSVIELVAEGGVDAMVSPFEPQSIDTVREHNGEDGTALRTKSNSFYYVGFNVRGAPFSNPYFRRIVARLVDKEWLVEDVFHGHATPLATPLHTEHVPSDLEWLGDDPEVPFIGEDGDIDERTAREALTSAGYRYDEDGNLVVRT